MTVRVALPSQSTRDGAAYFRDPSAAYLVRSRFLCASPGYDVFALFAWGKLGLDDARELLEVFEDSVRDGPGERRQLVVLREVEAVSFEALRTLVTFYVRKPPYLSTVVREAVARPDGVVGVMAEGLYPAVPLPFAHAVFRAEHDALRWLCPELDIDACGLTRWLAHVDALVQHHRAQHRHGLGALRETIGRLGARASIDEVARSMATSRRTLQRRLADAETSFRRERDRALVALATERLADLDLGIKQIADDLGFASESRFCEHFRRATGQTPTQWRRGRQDPITATGSR